MKNRIEHIIDKISSKFRFYKWEKKVKSRQPNIELTPTQKEKIKQSLKLPYRAALNSNSFYTSKTGYFSPYYIPDSIWYSFIEPYYNPRSLAKSLDTKVLYNRIFTKIAHPSILAYRINGYWIDSNYYPTDDNSVFNSIVNVHRVFLKQAEDSAGGKGVYSLTYKSTKEDFFNIIERFKGNIVIQVGVKQHESLMRINPTSVNTLRILTLLKKDKTVEILSAVVRIGRNGSVVDNASSGGIVVGINADGQLKEVAYNTKGDRFNEHPDTHIKFSSVVIPNFEQIKETLSELVWMLPQFRMLSWDIAIDQSGKPILIEVNMHSGQLDFHQLCNGPIFGDSTPEILNEIFNTKS